MRKKTGALHTASIPTVWYRNDLSSEIEEPRTINEVDSSLNVIEWHGIDVNFRVDGEVQSN